MRKIENIYNDGIGYVEILSIMGDDFTPAEDARTSTGKGRLGPEKDAQLQNRLLKDAHTSPFEGVLIKVEFVTPLFVLREIDRHRTLTKVSDEDLLEIVTPEESGRKWFARNERSGRYVQLPDSYYHPRWVRAQSTVDHQKDDGLIPDVLADEFLWRGKELSHQARKLYDWALENNIERGLARIYNTMNQYTKIRMTGSLKNWCDYLALRLPEGVLWECRVLTQALEQLLVQEFPTVMKQWRANVYDTVKLTRSECEQLRSLIESASSLSLIDTALIKKIEHFAENGK